MSPDARTASVLPMRSGGPAYPLAPEHLSDSARSWWDRLVRGWEIDDRGLLLLQSALEQWDVYQQAKELMDADGLVSTNPDSGHQHAHPAHAVARDALREFRQLFRALGLSGEAAG